MRLKKTMLCRAVYSVLGLAVLFLLTAIGFTVKEYLTYQEDTPYGLTGSSQLCFKEASLEVDGKAFTIGESCIALSEKKTTN